MKFLFLWVYWTFRSLLKVILRKITKLCELQRICYNSLSGAHRSLQIEFSLENSKQHQIKNMIIYMNQLCKQKKLRENMREALNNFVMSVLICKMINPRVHVEFVKSFGRCIEHIWGYEQLIYEVNYLAKAVYDAENEEHEIKLKKLWKLLIPETQLTNRISKQWQDIGFQGNDPKTDFRGMGILGLDNLLFFAEEYNNAARVALLHSHHPEKGYAFAILGINITNMALNLLLDGCGKTHFFNTSHRMPTIDSFHNFYCYLFIEFDSFWINSNPKSIMDFSKVRHEYEKVIRKQLKNENCILNVKNIPLEI